MGEIKKKLKENGEIDQKLKIKKSRTKLKEVEK
jgi:hypothetical protein